MGNVSDAPESVDSNVSACSSSDMVYGGVLCERGSCDLCRAKESATIMQEQHRAIGEGCSSSGCCSSRQYGARAEAFRSWLLQTYGEQLHAGVLDVAAGAGELSFILLNLHAINCVAVDPRALSVRPPLLAALSPPSGALRDDEYTQGLLGSSAVSV